MRFADTMRAAGFHIYDDDDCEGTGLQRLLWSFAGDIVETENSREEN